MNQGERKFLGCSQDVFSENGQSDFCTRENWQTAVLYLAQEMELFGLASPCTKGDSDQGQASLDVITLVNSSWKLIQMYRTSQQTVQDMETTARRTVSDRDRLAANTARQKEALELRERAVAESSEKERQASEQVESGQQKLKVAKEEVRKLMSVLLQREAKYSHEIRRSEQESARLKERLLKVLVEKGEGKGTGVNFDISGPILGNRNQRGKWNTDQTGSKREEELFRRVIDEMTKREEEAAEINMQVETALHIITTAVRVTLIELDTDPNQVNKYGPQLNTRSEEILDQAQNLSELLKASIKKVKKPSDAFLLDEKLSLYEEKMALYEQILANYETSKDKQDWIVRELKNLQKVSKENFITEKCNLEESHEQNERIKFEFSLEYAKIAAMKTEQIKASLSVSNEESSPQILLLPRQSYEPMPSWATGPVNITPSTCRMPSSGSGAVLGYSGPVSRPVSRPASRPVSRPASRPGSQPGSRAPSVHRERQEKGKSPAANIINKRTAAGRLMDSFSSSLGRKARPKSANISPSRVGQDLRSPTSINSRSQGVSRSPSRSKDQMSHSSLSLPRHSNQLNLKTNLDRSKRHSGKWSKPPTPGPLSPATSDSEASCYGYKSSLPKSSTMPFDARSRGSSPP